MTINFLNEIVKPYGFDNDYENGFEILIPRHHARLEEKKCRYTLDELYNKNIDDSEVYRFFIRPQIGSCFDMHGHEIVYVLPKTRHAIRIYLHPGKGYNIDNSRHREFIRSTDEIDRQIIRSFAEVEQYELRYIASKKNANTTQSSYLDEIDFIREKAYKFTLNDCKARTKEGRMLYNDKEMLRTFIRSNNFNKSNPDIKLANLNSDSLPLGFVESFVSPFKELQLI